MSVTSVGPVVHHALAVREYKGSNDMQWEIFLVLSYQYICSSYVSGEVLHQPCEKLLEYKKPRRSIVSKTRNNGLQCNNLKNTWHTSHTNSDLLITAGKVHGSINQNLRP